MTFRKALAISALVLQVSAGALAQLANTTSIVGTVTDSSGAAVSHAAVTAVNEATKDTYPGATNGAGYFALQFMRIGTYTVRVTASGFSTATHSGVSIGSNQVVRVDFTLQVGPVSQEVNVTGQPSAIATDDASVGQVLGSQEVKQLPLNGRDPLQLAVTTPAVINGLISPVGPDPGEMFIGAGTREIDNQVSLDGVSIINGIGGQADYHPSVDAVQEVSVMTGTFTAEFGNYQGVHIDVITKNGTNQVHGTAYEFLQNDALDARSFFEAPTARKFSYHLNQFGGEVDGPVVIPHLYNGKNRTFFMVDNETLRQVSSTASLTTVLTQQMRQGNFSQISAPIVNPFLPNHPAFAGNVISPQYIAPQAANILNYMPLPNSPGITNNYLAAVAFNNDWDQILLRIDHNIGDKKRFFFRWAWFNSSNLVGAVNPFNNYNNPDNNRNYAFGYTQTFTPNTINDFHFGYQSIYNQTTNIFYGTPQAEACTTLGIPGLTCSGLNVGIPTFGIAGFAGIGQGITNWYDIDSTWQATDVFNHTHGNHSLAAGVDFYKYIIHRAANNGPRGQVSFTGQLSGYAPADLLLGLPFSYITPGPVLFGDYAQYRYSFFALDKWEATRNLTLNIGLRYELPTVPTSTNGVYRLLNPQQTGFIPAIATSAQLLPLYNANHTDFAPRISMAYRIGPHWVALGGWGLYYGPNETGPLTLLTTNPPFSSIFTYQDVVNAPLPALSLNNLTPSSSEAPAPPQNAVTFSPHYPTPTMSQWSADIERDLWQNAGLDIQYLGSHSYNLDTSFYNNTPLPGPGNVQARRPNQLFGVIRTFVDSTIGNYDGLNVILNQRTSHGLNMRLFYTWSHTLDEGFDATDGGNPVNPYNFQSDYGNSSWDIRNRFVASIVYDSPFFKTSPKPWVSGILGNWIVSAIITVQSGLPFNVTTPIDVANTGRSNERPNVIGRASADCGFQHLVGCISTSAFALPTTFQYGDAARNLLYGPGMSNTDFALLKNVHLGERTMLEFRGESFNFFNSPRFANPNASFGTAAFGTVSSTSGNNRQMQIAAKLLF